MKRALFASLTLLGLTNGCSGTGVTLFDNETASIGSVAVLDPKSGRDIAVLDKANEQAGINQGRSVSTKIMSKDALEQRYGALLAGLPEQPRLFVLYFREGSTGLVDQSSALVPEVFAEVHRRPGADVQIVGHTDTVGDGIANDDLSKQRAAIVQTLLVSMGLEPSIVRATGRGEREPLEPTGNDVASVFNRRVEVFIK